MKSTKFGDRGPFIDWLFFTSYFATLSAFSASSTGMLPKDLTMSVALRPLISVATGYGVVFVFPIVFLALWVRKRKLRDIFSSLGLKRKGAVKSVLWSLTLFPLILIVGLIGTTLGSSRVHSNSSLF